MSPVTIKPELMFPTTPAMRVYVHHTGCQQATGIDGNHFQRLCDPMSGAEETYCAGCQGIFYASNFSWEDTQESVYDYRERMKQYVPPQVKSYYRFGYLIPGIILAAVVSTLLILFIPARAGQTPQEKWILSALLSVVVLVVMCYLSRAIGGIFVRKMYKFDYCRMR